MRFYHLCISKLLLVNISQEPVLVFQEKDYTRVKMSLKRQINVTEVRVVYS
jgi:hypothetical protein